MRGATPIPCLLAVLALCACGGSSGLSKAELTKRTGAACTAIRRAAVGLRTPNPRDPPQIARYFAHLMPTYERVVTGLREVKPASDAKGVWGRYVRAVGRELAYFEGVLVDAKAGKAPNLTGAGQYGKIIDELRAATADVGVTKSCAG